jgi:hypothetical protein
MKNYTKMLVLLFLISSLSFCATKKDNTLSNIKKYPERKATFYTEDIPTKIVDRIKMPHDEIIQYLCKMDSVDNYRPYMVSENEKKLFIEYYSFLPIEFQNVINDKVIAIYFIENFIGGGMTDFAYNSKDELVNVLYINPAVFKYSLSEWISLRENASFEKDDNIRIIAHCSDEYLGLLHLLLHEAAHIYDYHKHITPYILPILSDKSVVKTDFTKGIWKTYNQPYEKYDIIQKEKYSGWGLTTKLSIEKSLHLYKRLSETPFSTLYGSINWVEDFAESFTWKYLYEALNIDYQISILHNGEAVYTFSLLEKGINKRLEISKIFNRNVHD